VAVEALAQYEENQFMTGDELLSAQIEAASKMLAELLEIVKPYLLEVE
jgi:hypothetical protein